MSSSGELSYSGLHLVDFIAAEVLPVLVCHLRPVGANTNLMMMDNDIAVVYVCVCV